MVDIIIITRERKHQLI